jgi:hypothetical protein
MFGRIDQMNAQGAQITQIQGNQMNFNAAGEQYLLVHNLAMS